MKYLLDKTILDQLINIAYYNGKVDGILSKDTPENELDHSFINTIIRCYKVDDSAEVEV